MFLQLVLRNVFRQKLRSLLTALGILVAIVAFSLLRTMVDAWYSGVDAASSSRLVTRNAISLTFPLPISYGNKIRRVDGVTGVGLANWFAGVYISEKNFFPQFAVDAENYFSLFPEILMDPKEKSAFLHDRKGALVGRKVAKEFGWKIGDVVPLRGTIYPGTWSFVVRGIYTGARKNVDETMFFFHWDYLNETLKEMGDAQADHAGIFFVGIDRPERAAEISGEIDRVFKNSLAETLTETEKAFQLGFVAMTEAILMAVQVVSFVVIVIIMAVMANTMVMSVRERTREFATLRALGFGPPYVAGLIVGESLAISLGAGMLGVWATYPLVDYVGTSLGSLFPVFVLARGTVAMALAAALVVGLAAAVFPVWRVLRQGVAEGLRSMG
jgi:putative ABC transport system permease protein